MKWTKTKQLKNKEIKNNTILVNLTAVHLGVDYPSIYASNLKKDREAPLV